MRQILGVLVLATTMLPAQMTSDVMLMVDLENVVWYGNDGGDPARLMSSSAVTPIPSNFVFPFRTYLWFGDVVAVNGRPAKGNFVARGTWLALSTAAAPIAQRPIADINRNQLFDFLMEVLTPEGGRAGTLAGLGFGAGPAPAGTPPGSAAGNFAITGGSGAFVGARGQAATVSIANARTALAIEDPAYRRVNGGGRWRIGVTLVEVQRPHVIGAWHGSDFSPVTASNPARGGETIVLAVKRIGATQPVLEPGRMFPSDNLSQVVAPIEIQLNDMPGTVVNKVGWPGTSDQYRVDVVLPTGMPPGAARLSLTSSYIPGAEYTLPVR